MLPFLQPKKLASAISETRSNDGNRQDHNKQDHSLASRLIEAIHAKDVSAVANVIKELQKMDKEEDAASEG